LAGVRTGSRLLPALLAATVVTLTACGSSVNDPDSARCNTPHVTFGHKVVVTDHAEVEVQFRCVGAVLAGTLDLPKGAGPFPAVVYVHSSGETSRWRWSVPWVQQIVGAGIAFFSYDKRGVGESEGVCCPGDQSHFNLLAADADGAVNALRQRAEIEPARIGFLGTSQAGWVVPLAVVRSQQRVAFTALADAPAVTTHEEEQWSKLAGEDADNPPPLTKEKKASCCSRMPTTACWTLRHRIRTQCRPCWRGSRSTFGRPDGNAIVRSAGPAHTARTREIHFDPQRHAGPVAHRRTAVPRPLREPSDSPRMTTASRDRSHFVRVNPSDALKE
jgi:pimeloyl-ACP methyl ester carboxylesterase